MRRSTHEIGRSPHLVKRDRRINRALGLPTVEESRRLYAKARKPKRLSILSGLTHTEPYSKGLETFVEQSVEFLREAMP